MARARAIALRALFLLVAGAWALAMVYTGLGVLLNQWVLVDPPGPGPESPARWLRVGALVLVTGGVFVFALAASRCFPLASQRVKLVCELSPWAAALVVLVVGWL
ncbi:MAG: hypothetical protein K2W85_10430 [Phycisphaerales bacterium]|nr:hypothetical protein [Phycisphaerales bacterium]